MKQTAYTPFRAVYTTAVRLMHTQVQRWRDHLPHEPRTLLPAMAGARRVWGYRRAGLDVRSDRDIDSVFCRRNT